MIIQLLTEHQGGWGGSRLGVVWETIPAVGETNCSHGKGRQWSKSLVISGVGRGKVGMEKRETLCKPEQPGEGENKMKILSDELCFQRKPSEFLERTSLSLPAL